MVRTFISLLATLLLVAQKPAQRSAAPMQELGLTSELCFFRYEDNGRVNIADTKVHLSNYQTLIVEGGQAGCFYLMPGAYSFWVTSPDPSSGAGGAQTWRSPRYKVGLSVGERAVYEKFPNARDATYTGGWRAKLAVREQGLETEGGDK